MFMPLCAMKLCAFISFANNISPWAQTFTIKLCDCMNTETEQHILHILAISTHNLCDNTHSFTHSHRHTHTHTHSGPPQVLFPFPVNSSRKLFKYNINAAGSVKPKVLHKVEIKTKVNYKAEYVKCYKKVDRGQQGMSESTGSIANMPLDSRMLLYIWIKFN